jgi:hypothetical protein
MLSSGASGWAWREAFIRHRFIGEVQPSERRWAGGYNPNEIDCGRLAPPPRRGEIPVEYVDADIAYLWSGCQPVRLLGGASKWNLAVHGIRTGSGARAGYDAEGPDTAPTAVVCGTDPRVPWRSAPCEWALHNLRCERLGMFTPLRPPARPAGGVLPRAGVAPSRRRESCERSRCAFRFPIGSHHDSVSGAVVESPPPASPGGPAMSANTKTFSKLKRDSYDRVASSSMRSVGRFRRVTAGTSAATTA